MVIQDDFWSPKRKLWREVTIPDCFAKFEKDGALTVNESGTHWAIALVNRHPEKEVACAVKMKDMLLDGRYEATILAGDSPDAFNDVEHPNRLVPERTQLSFNKGVVNLPPHSLAIVRVPWK